MPIIIFLKGILMCYYIQNSRIHLPGGIKIIVQKWPKQLIAPESNANEENDRWIHTAVFDYRHSVPI